MNKVSIIMPVYNMEQFIRLAVDSVLSQTYLDYELVIIDDGSIDGSKSIAQEYINLFSPGITIIYHYQSNQGLACARNTGIAISSGEYIALLDPDDIWLPDRLEKEVEVLDKNPGVGL